MYEYEYKGHTIKIEVDSTPINPREGSGNLGTIVCFFDKEALGDSHAFDGPSDVMAYIKEQRAISKAIYSDLPTPSLKGWNTKQIGIIFTEAYKVYKKWDIKRVTPKITKQVIDILTKELNTYDQYLRGDVFCYSTSRQGGKPVKGSGCFYGYDFEENGLLESARAGVLDLMKGVGRGAEEQHGQYGLFDQEEVL